MRRRLELVVADALGMFSLKSAPSNALSLCRPVLSALPKYPAKAADFFRDLIFTEDRLGHDTTFWALWQDAADLFAANALVNTVDKENSDEGKLLDVLFLNIRWNDETRDWRPLHGQAHRVGELFKRLPPSREATRAFSYFLHKIGGELLPNALQLVSEKLHGPNATSLLSPDAVYCLELILARLIYGGQTSIRTDRQLHQSVLRLLDNMVEYGSSAAFKLRDDFLTPLRG